jgi:hypothetical protein
MYVIFRDLAIDAKIILSQIYVFCVVLAEETYLYFLFSAGQ